MLATVNCFRPSLQHVWQVNLPHVFDTFDIHLVTMDRPKALGEDNTLEPLSAMAWQQASKHWTSASQNNKSLFGLSVLNMMYVANPVTLRFMVNLVMQLKLRWVSHATCQWHDIMSTSRQFSSFTSCTISLPWQRSTRMDTQWPFSIPYQSGLFSMIT